MLVFLEGSETEEDMVERINNMKAVNADEIKAAVEMIDRANLEMNFMSEKVMPYGYPVTVESIVDANRDFEAYTKSSQEVLFMELQGLINILNHWIDQYNEPKVWVQVKNDKDPIEVPKSIADMIVEDKMGVYAQGSK